MEITKQTGLRGVVHVPGDKSISHRAVMFGALARGTTSVTHFLEGADCLSTISCFQKMGIEIEKQNDKVLIHGKGLRGLNSPREILDAGNSGNAMGADIRCRGENNCLPLRIVGRPLTAIHYTSPVASAQVKSCVLLAGMYADGVTSVTEPFLSRNHTEIMLRSFGADIRSEGTTVSIRPEPDLLAQDITVPGDISSAAFFIAAGLLTPGSEILLKNVGINPTRAGILKVCQDMGADITLLNADYSGEPAADILVRTSSLKGTVIQGADIPTLIDELPVIAVMAAFAGGTTVIRDAAELRVKESDRIAVMTDNLRRMGADVEETEDGMIIHGGRPLHGAVIDPRLDHRVAMSFAVAGTVCEGTMDILDGDCVRISYPDFYKDLYSLG